GRRYGRPWVERNTPAGVRERFARRLGSGRAEWVVFWLMMVPAFPRDPLCYLAALTRLTPLQLGVIARVGRPVGLAPWVALRRGSRRVPGRRGRGCRRSSAGASRWSGGQSGWRPGWRWAAGALSSG